MNPEKPQVRLEEWLEKDLDDFMKRHKLKSRTKALHQYHIDVKQQKEESAKENKRLREEVRHYRKKAEKQAAKDHQKADSTSKPQQEEKWKVTTEWINKVQRFPKSGIPSPFPCPFEEGKICRQMQRRECKKKYRSKFEYCEEIKRSFFKL